MIRLITALSVVALVGACGGSRFSSGNAVGGRAAAHTSAVQFANGPIYTACKTAGRKQASRTRCGCIQAVANRSLNRSDQIRGAGFFKDPQNAQDTRQSDNPASERFWKKWKSYSADSARLCT
jgi:hypothetical protein